LVRLRHGYVGVMITGPGHRPSLEAPTSVVDLFATPEQVDQSRSPSSVHYSLIVLGRCLDGSWVSMESWRGGARLLALPAACALVA
jgi:hypothetical protein